MKRKMNKNRRPICFFSVSCFVMVRLRMRINLIICSVRFNTAPAVTSTAAALGIGDLIVKPVIFQTEISK